MKNEVALVDSDIRALIRAGTFTCFPTPEKLQDYVQPASLDIPLGNRCCLVKHKILPHGKDITSVIPDLVLSIVDLHEPDLEQKDLDSGGTLLLKGQTYLVPCGVIHLPPGVRASFSPKSSIGRLDVMVRAVFDRHGLYDLIHPGESGQLWMEITPRSFNIRIYTYIALSQMMLFREKTSIERGLGSPLPPLAMQTLTFDAQGDPTEQVWHEGCLVLSLSLRHNPIGYEAIECSEVIDLHPNAKKLDPKSFFRPIELNQYGSLTLLKDHFYILCTTEYLQVNALISGEMLPFSHHIGELRAHKAGLFDSGFGMDTEDQQRGAIAVLEVCPNETICVVDSQPIALMRFFHNTKSPDVLYGKAGNHYSKQRGPRLAKYFQTKEEDEHR